MPCASRMTSAAGPTLLLDDVSLTSIEERLLIIRPKSTFATFLARLKEWDATEIVQRFFKSAGIASYSPNIVRHSYLPAS